ncbi:17922_t:CDS:2 [Dentiscutata erythropus]|uniref:17922_t:CDS:1 n=1 Tax=Dentiscutata erythropus TaxID=1348616 RepID=A0A9N9GB15_9GLOM|nr:17922_t:CDS:2 [Dentiscutata erythropus]
MNILIKAKNTSLKNLKIEYYQTKPNIKEAIEAIAKAYLLKYTSILFIIIINYINSNNLAMSTIINTNSSSSTFSIITDSRNLVMSTVINTNSSNPAFATFTIADSRNLAMPTISKPTKPIALFNSNSSNEILAELIIPNEEIVKVSNSKEESNKNISLSLVQLYNKAKHAKNQATIAC